MKIKQPGQGSSLTFVFTFTWVILALLVLLGGHAVIAFSLWESFKGETGVLKVADIFDVPQWLPWILAVGALLMDGWIVTNIRKEKKRYERH